MKILYLHQYFITPRKVSTGGLGNRSYEFARRWVKWGHEVKMICSQMNPLENTPRDWYVTDEDGIEVHWLPVPYSNCMGVLERIRVFMHFALRSARRAAILKADIIFATSTPLTIAIPAIYAKKRTGLPMVFEVRDLWPEAPRQMGVLRNPLLFWLAKQLERSAYRNAAHVNTLSPGIQEGVLAEGIPAANISMIPNCSDLDAFHPSIDGQAKREELQLGNDLCFMYFGAFGPANGLDFVVKAARELESRGVQCIRFVMIGDGREHNHLLALAEKYELHNIQFHGVVPRSDIPSYIAAADVCLTIFKNLPILRTNSPNKFFDALSSGKPVLTNMIGWIGDMVTQYDCGVVVEPDNVKDFANKVLELKQRKKDFTEMGYRARQLAEKEFSRDKLARDLLDIFERVHEKNHMSFEDGL